MDNATHGVEEALGAKLFGVATHQGQLEECFLEARELVGSIGLLLGCPEKEQERWVRSQRPRRSTGGGYGTCARVSAPEPF